jgi:XcyI restriction endonuclease
MKLPDPTLQIEFATLLEGARSLVLAEALRETVGALSATRLDVELAQFVDDASLTRIASFGIRAETVFPVPLLLSQKPSLIGYYRLLYGYSQKQFYTSATGCSLFKTMEMKGLLTNSAAGKLPELCAAFADAGSKLLSGLGKKASNATLFQELALLTLGAQFRGGANNQRGAAGIRTVFEVVRMVVNDGIVSEGESLIEVKNAAGKRVSIEIAADPDIFISTVLDTGEQRPIVAIEVKAGEDHSNIWNRIGEAEKSHQQAKARGVTECWTIINDDKASPAKLRTSSPTTNRFYQLLELADSGSTPYADFASRVRDMIGLG